MCTFAPGYSQYETKSNTMPVNTKGRGVLPVTAAQTKKPPKQQQPRPPAPRLRLIIRRLPPGLTETEFWNCIGVDWQVGKGKVDWAAYKAGKISKDLAKPSRPARAYLKVKDPSYLDQLSTQLRIVNFHDAKNSVGDPCLIGPPSLEFAPYNKIPSTRLRHDGRQGTIDQDPEFIDFLQSLTEPITKSAANEESLEARQEKATITPLVQYIKEKKANKAKEKEAAVAAKASAKKGQEVKEMKDVKENKDSKAAPPTKPEKAIAAKKGVATEVDKAKVAKATQQAMESIKKSVAEIKGQTTPKQEPKPMEKKELVTNQPTPKRERQRGDASAAARIIGRDLGLVPKEGRASRGQRAVTSPAPAPVAPLTAVDINPSTNSPAAAKPPPPQPAPSNATKTLNVSPQPPTGPRNLRNAPPQLPALQPVATLQPSKSKSVPQPSPGARSAFLKHANPSQGVTEALLRETFSVYGTITRCEIDRKKGLGYIDFTESEALKKAMSASPIKIGNGSVVVLENRTPYKKVSQHATRSNTNSPTPNPSTPSSPRVVQASLSNIAEQAQPSATIEPTQPLVQSVEPDPAAIRASTLPTTNATPAAVNKAQNNVLSENASQSPSSSTAAAPPSAPRGNNRANYRGRGYRGGKGGQFRGGNRAASSPNPNAATNTPAAPAANGKT
ncbi:hypothetical protein LTR64_002413 [Lithohypha guttulata]|uniref:uncharacterized protein n=1 Tax=Lithohypha guttulata TaxID=1690604 RepID=UPI00315CBD8C